MPLLNATGIHRFDVVIIGGGIAGLAIAELLSRRSQLSIKVVDAAPQLGMGASGKLEGWFHTGALYAQADDAQTFVNCVNGIEDLITLYSNYFNGRCNLALTERGPGQFAPAVTPREGAWFNDAPIFYIHPGQDSPDIRLSRLKSDAAFLEVQRERVLGRLEAAFGRHNWGQDGACRAPTYGQIEEHEGRTCSLLDTSGVVGELCRRFDESYGLTESRYDIIKSPDVTVNTAAVMRDLAASAFANGVEIETDVTIENLVLDRFGPRRLKGLAYKGHDGRPGYLKARVFVFAVGAGFERYLQELDLRVRLKMSRSAMVVASPALNAINFVRMSTKQQFHFNHLQQQGPVGTLRQPYSMLANSGFSGDTQEATESLTDIDQLLESAERYFGGERLYGSALYAYECIKTEFISEEEEKRRYSYWIETNRDGNSLCVLPGKFSFFPTVAHQTCLRLKDLLDYKEIPAPGSYLERADARERATRLVADPYPVRILSLGGPG